jgi:uncharacterized membrane protein YdbT with pleckstrin-like domain
VSGDRIAAGQGEPPLSYFDRVVKPDETVLIRTGLHWVIYLAALPPLLAAIVLALAPVVRPMPPAYATALYVAASFFAAMALVTFLGRLITSLSTEFGVTTHRVIVKRGLISLHTVEMNVDKVESVDVDQSLIGRMLGFGTVTIHGIGARWDPIPQIADPVQFRNAITTH